MGFSTKESTHDSPLLLGQQQKRIKNLFPCKNCSSLVDLFINSFGSCSRLVSFFSSTRRELVHPRGLSEKNMGAQDFRLCSVRPGHQTDRRCTHISRSIKKRRRKEDDDDEAEKLLKKMMIPSLPPTSFQTKTHPST
jgi:hypothetical protein